MISIDDNAPSDLEAHSSNNLPITIALTSRRAARNDFFTPGTLDDGRTRPQALSSNNYPGDFSSDADCICPTSAESCPRA